MAPDNRYGRQLLGVGIFRGPRVTGCSSAASSSLWFGQAGLATPRTGLPGPENGYQHALTKVTGFDPGACRFTDTWWEQDQPQQRHTQTGRCYTPADFRPLLEGNGLTLAAACVAGEPIRSGRVPYRSRGSLLTPSRQRWGA